MANRFSHFLGITGALIGGATLFGAGVNVVGSAKVQQEKEQLHTEFVTDSVVMEKTFSQDIQYLGQQLHDVQRKSVVFAQPGESMGETFASAYHNIFGDARPFVNGSFWQEFETWSQDQGMLARTAVPQEHQWPDGDFAIPIYQEVDGKMQNVNPHFQTPTQPHSMLMYTQSTLDATISRMDALVTNRAEELAQLQQSYEQKQAFLEQQSSHKQSLGLLLGGLSFGLLSVAAGGAVSVISSQRTRKKEALAELQWEVNHLERLTDSVFVELRKQREGITDFTRILSDMTSQESKTYSLKDLRNKETLTDAFIETFGEEYHTLGITSVLDVHMSYAHEIVSGVFSSEGKSKYTFEQVKEALTIPAHTLYDILDKLSTLTGTGLQIDTQYLSSGKQEPHATTGVKDFFGVMRPEETPELSVIGEIVMDDFFSDVAALDVKPMQDLTAVGSEVYAPPITLLESYLSTLEQAKQHEGLASVIESMYALNDKAGEHGFLSPSTSQRAEAYASWRDATRNPDQSLGTQVRFDATTVWRGHLFGSGWDDNWNPQMTVRDAAKQYERNTDTIRIAEKELSTFSGKHLCLPITLTQD